MARNGNIVHDDNIHNTRHAKRNEVPLDRFKQNAGNEIANSVLDAYDNMRDNRADNRQQQQRIREFQQERLRTGTNAEKLHFQRKSNINSENQSAAQSRSDRTDQQSHQSRQQPHHPKSTSKDVEETRFLDDGGVEISKYHIDSTNTRNNAHPASTQSSRTSASGSSAQASNIRLYNIGDRTFKSAGEQYQYFKANQTDLLSKAQDKAHPLAINGRAYHSVPNVEALEKIVRRTAEERTMPKKVAVKTAYGVIMVDEANLKKEEMDAEYDDRLAQQQVRENLQNLQNSAKSHINDFTNSTLSSSPVLQTIDGTNPDSADFSHDTNAVINPGRDGMPVDVTMPVKTAFKQSDVYQGYKTLKTVRNTFKGTGNRQAEAALKAYGFERTKGLNIRQDIKNKLAINERSLNMVAVNVANLDVNRINSMLRHGNYNGQVLNENQLKLLEERRDLLRANNEINFSRGYNLGNMANDKTIAQSDVYQGAKTSETAGRVAAKTANVALSASAGAVGALASGTARLVGSSSLGKAGQVIGDFSAASLTGKFKMAGSGTAHIVTKGAKIVGRATVRKFGGTRAGQAVANAKVRVGTSVNNTKARVVNTMNAGRARVVNSKSGRAVSSAYNNIQRGAGQINAVFQHTLNRARNSGLYEFYDRTRTRFNAVNTRRIQRKHRRKDAFEKVFKKATKGLRIAAIVILLLVTLVTCVPSAIMGVVSAQGSTTSSKADSDEPSLMQQAVAKMYSKQISLEDDLRDGSGGSSFEPDHVNVTYNGTALSGGLSSLGISSIMKGVKNISVDALSTKYVGSAERVETITKNWTEYTPNANGAVSLKVKDTRLNYYKKKTTKTIKIYYKDLCVDGDETSDFITKYKKPPVVDASQTSGYREDSFGENEYFRIKKKDLEKLEDMRWLVATSGGITSTPMTETTYKPTGYYSYETVYAPAGGEGKVGGMYTVPTKWADGKWHTGSSFDIPDPTINVKYQDENGNIVSVNQLYKAICAAASAGTHNTSIDREYFQDWCDLLMLYTMNSGYVNIDIKTEADPDTKFCWFGYDDADVMPCDGSDVTGTDAEKFKSMNKGARILYTATGQKMTINIDYVVTTSFEKLLKRGDKVTLEWQQEHAEKCAWKANTWKGFHNSDGTLNDTGKCAQAWYEMDDTAYSDMGIIFPGNTYPILSEAKIDAIIAQIKLTSGGKLTAQREAVVRAGLQYVGRFVYTYAGGHGSYASKAIAASTVGTSGGVDCSGFVSFVTNQGGVFHNNGSDGYTAQGACDFTHFGSATSKGNLRPGDIVVKNAEAGGSTTSNNHVVIYGGKFDTGDGAGVIDRFIECTTTNNMVDGQAIQDCSGSQISKQSRSNYILNNYQYFRNPYGD